jgi:hypothetical protein
MLCNYNTFVIWFEIIPYGIHLIFLFMYFLRIKVIIMLTMFIIKTFLYYHKLLHFSECFLTNAGSWAPITMYTIVIMLICYEELSIFGVLLGSDIIFRTPFHFLCNNYIYFESFAVIECTLISLFCPLYCNINAY